MTIDLRRVHSTASITGTSIYNYSGATMNMSLKTLAANALFTLAAAGLSTSAMALDFMPLGEGALPSGSYVEDFQFTILPGETVPWHYHPGKIYGVIVSGTLTEDHGCGEPLGQLSAGSAFIEQAGAIHQVFNYGTEPVVIVFTFIVPAANKDYNGITLFVNGPRCHHDR
jgi:quercetin dioxygenase-like cupin family protein